MTDASHDVRAKFRALEAKPVALEALWDGDSAGWNLSLFAVLRDATGQHRSIFVHTFVDPRGDYRLFRGRVPPWDEAVRAQALGAALSAELGIPFHVPSPEWPEPDCPHWWELNLSDLCADCGIPLLQRQQCPWKGRCYRCHLATKRALQEALLSPEDRERPRCCICGRPSKGAVRGQNRCERCLSVYVGYDCAECGCWIMTSQPEPRPERCGRCTMVLALRQQTPTLRRAILDAAAHGRIAGIVAARDVLGCDIHEAELAVRLLEDRVVEV